MNALSEATHPSERTASEPRTLWDEAPTSWDVRERAWGGPPRTSIALPTPQDASRTTRKGLPSKFARPARPSIASLTSSEPASDVLGGSDEALHRASAALESGSPSEIPLSQDGCSSNEVRGRVPDALCSDSHDLCGTDDDRKGLPDAADRGSADGRGDDAIMEGGRDRGGRGDEEGVRVIERPGHVLPAAALSPAPAFACALARARACAPARFAAGFAGGDLTRFVVPVDADGRALPPRGHAERLDARPSATPGPW
jgi:hypothetical protein